MNKFAFKQNLLKLEFENKTFEVDTIKVIIPLRNLEATAGEIASSFAQDTINDNAVESACIKLVNGIDDILGDGAHKDIFAGRTVGFYDCVDVIAYISTEIKTFNEAKAKEYKKAAKK